ncbi:lysozyme 1B-like isoform X2 [Lucilia sericata]|uniref:lysozyme 1B-like isoform X2 n=1 Tax=Lucilia sericata TaxID=13632 RepID=UPI0018A7EC9D|nr:lysozyme 1B-like isoform X2 [Lucilia sericata]
MFCKNFVKIFCVIIINILFLCEGRILKRCDLAREMLRLGTSKHELATWCCIAQFEISDRYWCQSRASRPSANLCKVSCQSLITDNIAEAVKCAHNVKKRQGWRAWAAYNGRCNKLKSLPSIEECF